MATHRVVLKVSDRELECLSGAIESMDGLAERYVDDWDEDEEPLVSINDQTTALVEVIGRIRREVEARKGGTIQ